MASAGAGGSPPQSDGPPATRASRGVSSATLVELASFVPQAVLRFHTRRRGPASSPLLQELPGAVLFSDISGFTSFSEQLSRLGDEGVEVITVVLNRYFRLAVEVVQQHGGDVCKFAGDALQAVWTDRDLADAARLAVACGLALKARLEVISSKELLQDCDLALQTPVHLSLSCHSTVGIGSLQMAHLGGVNGRLEFVVGGEPMAQIQRLQLFATKQAMVVLDAVRVLLGDCECTAIDQDAYEIHACSPGPLPGPAPHVVPGGELETTVRSYIVGVVKARFDAGQRQFLGELRRVTVMFCSVHLDLNNLEQCQQTVRSAQECIYHHGGTIRQLIVDDKGSVIVSAFGLPPFVTEEGAAHAVKAALQIRSDLKNCNIGIATGTVFCGAIGDRSYREYAMVGPEVNLAARLMAAASVMGAGGTSGKMAVSLPVIPQRTAPEAGSLTPGGKRQSMSSDVVAALASGGKRQSMPTEAVAALASGGKRQSLPTFASEVSSSTPGTAISTPRSGTTPVPPAPPTEPDASGSPLLVDGPGVLCDEATHWEINSPNIECVALPPINVKGRVEPVPIFRPIQRRGRAGSIYVRSQFRKRRFSKRFSLHPLNAGSQLMPSVGEIDADGGSATPSVAGEPPLGGSSTTGKHESGSQAGDDVAMPQLPPVVGRDTEMRLLRERLLLVEQDLHAGVAFLQGDPGLGKTRLMSFIEQAAREMGLNVFAGTGHILERNTPNFAWRDIATDFFDQAAATDDHDAERRLKGALNAVSPSWIPYAPLLNTMLPDLELAENETTRLLSGKERSSKLTSLIVAVLEHRQQQGKPGIVLLFEDGHDVDSASFTLLAEVSKRVSPLFIVVATRMLPDTVPDLPVVSGVDISGGDILGTRLVYEGDSSYTHRGIRSGHGTRASGTPTRVSKVTTASEAEYFSSAAASSTNIYPEEGEAYARTAPASRRGSIVRKASLGPLPALSVGRSRGISLGNASSERHTQQPGSSLNVVGNSSGIDADGFRKLLASPEALVLRLYPHKDTEVVALACYLVDAKKFMSGLRKVLLARAQGNPLYVEELMFYLRETGALELNNGVCGLSNEAMIQNLSAPESIKGLITSRIDRLSQEAQLLIKIASVIGQRFTTPVLQHCLQKSGTMMNLKRELKNLLRMGVLQRDGKSFMFKQVVMQEVSYDLLLPSQRKELHGVIGDFYESSATDLRPFFELLAHHFDRAANYPKALLYSRRAGQQAFENHAFVEAVQNLRRVLTLTDFVTDAGLDLLDEVRLHRQLGECLYSTGDFGSMDFHLDKALSLLRAPIPETRTRMGIAIARLLLGWRPVVGDVDRLLEVARVYEVYFLLCFYRQLPAAQHLYVALAGLRVIESALSGRGPVDTDTLAAIRRQEGRCLAMAALVTRPIPWVGESIAAGYALRARATSDDWTELVLSLYELSRGNTVEAKRSLSLCLDLSRGLGDAQREEEALLLQAHLNLCEGRVEAAVSDAELVIASATTRESRPMQSFATSLLAHCLLRYDHLDEAMDRIQIMLGGSGSTYMWETALHCVYALALTRKRKYRTAVVHAEMSLESLTVLQPSLLAVSMLLRDLGEVFSVALSKSQAVRSKRSQVQPDQAETLTKDAIPRIRTRLAQTIALLRKQAKHVSGAEQVLLLVSGNAAASAGASKKAIALWEESLEVTSPLPYEEALAHWNLARALIPSQKGLNHLNLAGRLFTRLNDGYYFKRVNALATSLPARARAGRSGSRNSSPRAAAMRKASNLGPTSPFSTSSRAEPPSNVSSAGKGSSRSDSDRHDGNSSS